VLTLFGAGWMPVIPLLLILAPLGAVQSIATTVGHIYMAKGRTDWALWLPPGVPGWLTLSLLLPLGAAVYFACSWAINRALLLEVISILRGKG